MLRNSYATDRPVVEDLVSHVLLAGESWVSATVDHKGYDAFPHTQLEVGCTEFVAALESRGHSVEYLPTHEVAENFPETVEKLKPFDVVILSDVGANTMLLPPQVFKHGRRFPNRLKLLAHWVRDGGGGLMMAGGYLSFQGFQAKANYHGTPIEDILPVTISPFDDRVEAPEGIAATLTGVHHPVTAGLDETWPFLLGYQRLTARDDAQVLAVADADPLVVIRHVGNGRTLAFASDISPHWAPDEFMTWPGYASLFAQAVSWLAGSSAP